MRIAVIAMTGAALCGAQTTVNGGRVYLGTLKAGGSSATIDFSAAQGAPLP